MTTDELGEHGMVKMDDGEIHGFLSSQNVGVLGLPTEGAPALRPMSFWFDGDSQLYFPYLVGSTSRKVKLSDRTTAARFLVYRAETPVSYTHL
ncbi:pyridoxamine 5'-phosphate oxidase family protein, partial [Halococcus thailandensis]